MLGACPRAAQHVACEGTLQVELLLVNHKVPGRTEAGVHVWAQVCIRRVCWLNPAL